MVGGGRKIFCKKKREGAFQEEKPHPQKNFFKKKMEFTYQNLYSLAPNQINQHFSAKQLALDAELLVRLKKPWNHFFTRETEDEPESFALNSTSVIEDIFRYTPVVIQAKDRDGDSLNIHVFGLFEVHYAGLTEDAAIDVYANPLKLSSEIQSRYCFNGFLAAKLVHKSPLRGAAEGPRFLAKLYFGKDYTGDRHVAQRLAECTGILRPPLLHTGIARHTRYLMGFDAPPVGRLVLPPELAAAIVREGSIRYVNVHRDDVRFVTHRSVVHRDLGPLVGKIKALVSKDQGAKAQPTSRALRAIVETNLSKRARTWSWEGRKSFKEFKRMVMSSVLPTELMVPHRRLRVENVKRQANSGGAAAAAGGKEETMADFIRAVVIFQYALRRTIHSSWAELFAEQIEEQEMARDRQLYEVAKQRRIACFDIETNFEPHSAKDDEIIHIHCTLYDQDRILQQRGFYYRYRSDFEVDVELVKKLVRAGLNLKPDQKREGEEEDVAIVVKDTEKEMLAEFLGYLVRAKADDIVHYNGHRFDVPLLIYRCEELRVAGLVPYRGSYGGPSDFPFNQRRIYRSPFGQRRDVGTIKYRRDNRKSEVSRARSMIRQSWRRGAGAKGDNDGNDNDDDDNDDDGEEDVPEDDRVGHRKKSYAAMKNARSINSIVFNTLGSRDVMMTLPDLQATPGDPRPVDRTLGCYARYFLGLDKLDHECVKYENLAKTWRGESATGNPNYIIAYTWIDVELTVALDRKMDNNMSTAMRAAMTYRTPRELYPDTETLRTIVTLSYAEGRPLGLVGIDTIKTEYREDDVLRPGHEFNLDRDFPLLRNRAGRTISHVQGSYTEQPMAMFDFVSQYPSIIIGLNICMATMLSKKGILELEEGKDFIRVVIQNTCPKVVWECRCGKTPCALGAACFAFTYVRVFYEAYFATEKFFPGILCRLCVKFLKQRAVCKAKLASAEADDSNTAILKHKEQAVKRLANSTYGCATSFTNVVGGAITQIGRDQNELASEYLFENVGPIAMADTDSVAPLMMKITPPFSRMVKIATTSAATSSSSPPPTIGVKPGDLTCKAMSVRQIARYLIDYVARHLDHLNNGTYWSEPAKLLLEKIAVAFVFLQKKQYMMVMLNPDLSMAARFAGLACRKSTRTNLMDWAQRVSLYQLSDRDVPGFLVYAYSLFAVVHPAIRAHEIAETEKRKLLLADDETTLREFLENGTFEKIVRANHGADLIDMKHAISREKAKDVYNPRTVAEKVARLLCIERGTDLDHADFIVDVIRNSAVQVGNHLVTILATLLIRPFDTEKEKAREEGLWALIERRLMGLTSQQYEAYRNQRQKVAERRAAKAEEMTPLKITDMPEKFKASKSLTDSYSLKTRLEIRVLKKRIELMLAATEKERKSGFKKLLPGTALPLELFDRARIQRMRQRVETISENYIRNIDRFPLWWYDEAYTRLDVSNMRKDHWFPVDAESLDLWQVYVDTDMRSRYLIFNRGRIMDTDDANPSLRRWPSSALYLMWRCPIKEESSAFVLDMGGDYALQTSSTPLIVGTPAGTRYLINRNSFKSARQNRFSFKLATNTLDAILKPDEDERGTLAFRPTDTAVEERSIGVLPLPGGTFLRDDGRKMPRWRWSKRWHVVKKRDLRQALTKHTPERPVALELFRDEYVWLSFIEDAKVLSVTTDSAPYSATVPFELLVSRKRHRQESANGVGSKASKHQ